jgi:hypothetical protein
LERASSASGLVWRLQQARGGRDESLASRCGLRAAGCGLRAASCELRAACCVLRAVSGTSAVGGRFEVQLGLGEAAGRPNKGFSADSPRFGVDSYGLEIELGVAIGNWRMGEGNGDGKAGSAEFCRSAQTKIKVCEARKVRCEVRLRVDSVERVDGSCRHETRPVVVAGDGRRWWWLIRTGGAVQCVTGPQGWLLAACLLTE